MPQKSPLGVCVLFGRVERSQTGRPGGSRPFPGNSWDSNGWPPGCSLEAARHGEKVPEVEGTSSPRGAMADTQFTPQWAVQLHLPSYCLLDAVNPDSHYSASFDTEGDHVTRYGQ